MAVSNVTGSLSSAGIGSGLDVGSIVNALMSVEQKPLQDLQAKATTMQTQVSALGTLKGQIAKLGDMATVLTQPATWNPIAASSSNAVAVSVSADSTAAAGTHALTVQQLAQAQVLASGAFTTASTTVGTGKLSIELGSTAAGVFTPASGSTATSITIDPSNASLTGIRDAINASGAGVTASIVTGADGARLVLRSAEGAASSVRITATDDDGNNTDAAGLSALAFDPAAAAGSGQNLSQSQAAQDAAYTLDGIALTSKSNQVTGALQGVSITLAQVTSSPVTLGFSVQSAAVRKNIGDFVSAYNALNALIRQQTTVDASGNNDGPLQGDSTAQTVQNQMHQLLFGAVAGMASGNTLAAAGISLQRDGSLQVDDGKLGTALKNPSAVQDLFVHGGTAAPGSASAATSGFAFRFKAWATALSDTGGVLQDRLDGLATRKKDNQKRQDNVQARLTATEAQLRKQYQTLDSRMTALNAEMARMKSALGLG